MPGLVTTGPQRLITHIRRTQDSRYDPKSCGEESCHDRVGSVQSDPRDVISDGGPVAAHPSTYANVMKMMRKTDNLPRNDSM